MRCFTWIFFIVFSNFSLADFIPPEKLFQNYSVESIAISPAGSMFSLFVNENGKQKLYVSKTDSIKFSQVNFYKPFFLHGAVSVDWLDEKHFTVIPSQSNYSYKPIIVRVDGNEKSGFKTSKIRFKPNLKGVVVAVLPGQEVLLARAYGLDKLDVQLYRLPLKDLLKGKFGSKYKIGPKIDSVISFHASVNGTDIMVSTLSAETVDFWYLDQSEGQWKLLYSKDDLEENFIPLARRPSGDFAVLSNRISDRLSVVNFSMKDELFGEVIFQNNSYDLTGAVYDSIEDRVVSVSYLDHGRFTQEIFVEASQAMFNSLAATFPDKQIILLAADSVGKWYALLTFSSDDPGSVYLLKRKPLQAYLIADMIEDLDGYELSSSTPIRSISDEGKNIEASLYRPIKHDNKTLLIMPHGGPIGVRDYNQYNPQIQFLADRGYTVLTVNFRGSWGFGREFLDAGRGQFGKGIESDILAAYETVVQDHNFNHVCTIGSSYGGYSAMMLAINRPEEIDCVVSMFGVYDLPLLFSSSNLHQTESYRSALRSIVGDNSLELKNYSPIFLADKLDVPTLIIAGMKDKVAHFEQSSRMALRLERLGKKVTSLFFPGVGHGHHFYHHEWHQFLYIDSFIRDATGNSYHASVSKQSKVEDFLTLGRGFESNGVLPKDLEKAVGFYHKAAKLNNPSAMYKLGVAYSTGRGGIKDPEKGRLWLEKAIELGETRAKVALADVYYLGIGVEKNAEAARDLLVSAIEEGDQGAHWKLALFDCLGGEDGSFDFNLCESSLFHGMTQKDKFLDVFYKKYGVDSVDVLNSILSKLFMSDSFSQESERLVLDMIQRRYGAKTYHPKFKQLGYGAFDSDARNLNSPSVDKLDEIPLVKGMQFGIQSKIWGDKKTDGTFTLLREKWFKVDKGEKILVEERFVTPKLGQEYSFIREVDKADHEELGEWQVLVTTLDGEVLTNRSFELVPIH